MKEPAIRCYALVLSPEKKKILVNEENLNGIHVVKLPGGGLEKGETPIECIKRELMEENGISRVNIKGLLFVCHNPISSYFARHTKVLSLYFTVIVGEDDVKRGKWVEFSLVKPSMFAFVNDRKCIRIALKWASKEVGEKCFDFFKTDRHITQKKSH